MKILIHWILRALAVLIAAYLLPGIFVESFWVALFVAIVLGFLNTFIRPLLMLITLPLQILTLGLFTIVINAALILLVSNMFTPVFRVDGFWYAVLFSAVVAILNGLLHIFEPSSQNTRKDD
jgi:putative membrane protein